MSLQLTNNNFMDATICSKLKKKKIVNSQHSQQVSITSVFLAYCSKVRLNLFYPKWSRFIWFVRHEINFNHYRPLTEVSQVCVIEILKLK